MDRTLEIAVPRHRDLIRRLLAAGLAAVVLSCAPRPEPDAPLAGRETDEAGAVGARADTLAIPPLPVPRMAHRPDQPGADEGLVVRLREGPDAGATPAGEPAPAAGTAEPLSADRTARLLARLPALPAPDTASFRFPTASPPPPRTGRVVLTPFPPPDSLEQPAPPPAEPAGPLRVVRILPSGETELAPHVTITFSEPMVPLTTVGGTLDRDPPVRLDPRPAGRWSWLDPRTLRFEPEGRLPMATTFTVEVPEATRSVAGRSLGGAVRGEFSTPAPRATGAFPALPPDERPGPPDPRDRRRFGIAQEHARAVPLEPVILVAFDQRVEPGEVAARARAFADGRPRRVRHATPAELAADSLTSRLAADLEDGRWVALRPVEPLPGAADVRVVLPAGTPSAEGPRTTTRPQTLRFRTYGPFEIVSTGCYDSTCRPGQPLRIQLSNPVDESAWSPELVRVEPGLEDMTVRVFGGEIRIDGRTRANTRYVVTLSAEVRDRFGQRLREPHSATFDVGSPLPSVSIAGAPIVVLDPEGPTRVTVRSHGIRALRVRVHRVAPEQWTDFVARVEGWRRTPGATLSPPGEEVVSRVVELAGGGTEFRETVVDVGAVLREGLGHAVVVVEPAGGEPSEEERDRRWRPTLSFAWVQSTRIGLAAQADAEDLLVWATSLRTGAPVDGAELTLLPTGRGGRTAADGTARIPLSPVGDGALIARAGGDAALLPAHERLLSPRQLLWRRRSRAAELRWHMLTDRGLYQPGEAVHLKGWLRRFSGAPGDGPEIASGVTGVELELRGPRGEDLGTATVRPGELGGFDTVFALPEALNLGRSRIEARALGLEAAEQQSGHHGFRIQEFRRPDYEVRAEADPGPHVVGGVVDVALTAAYYGGGELPGAPVEWRVSTRPTAYQPPGWSRWHFGRPLWWGRSRGGEIETLEGITDASGTHRLRIDLVSADPPFAAALRAEGQVSDLTRQVGSAGADLIVHPAALNVGVRLERGWIHEGETADLRVVVVEHDGRAVSGRSVQVALERLRGTWWRPDADTADSGRVVCAVRSAAEPVPCRIAPDSAGPHRIRAEVRDDAGRLSRTEILLRVSGAPGAPDPRTPRGSIELVADRDEYQPGDTARILVQPPFRPAEALVTVRNRGVLSRERVRIDGPSYELEVPIAEAHIPVAQVRVELVDAEGGLGFAAGATELTVPPGTRALDVAVIPGDTVAAPGASTTIDVEVRGPDGQPAAGAEVALWMVDEAVLGLADYTLADPLDVFYPRRHEYVFDQHLRRWVVRWPRSAGPGTLSGRVIRGGDGRAIPGATVRIEGTGVEATTAFDGEFTLRGLDPGGYVLEVTAPDGTTGRRTVTVPPEGLHTGSLVLGAEGLVVQAEEAAGDESEIRLRGISAVAAAPAPSPEPALRLDAIVVTGAGAGGDEPVATRSEFVPLAFFEPSLRTDASGRARVTAALPQSLTRYRVMAVAVSGAERFGTGEATVTARKELMVRLTAPRFLHYGDTLELPVLVQNATDRTLDVEVAARATGLDVPDPAGRRVTLPPGARAEVRFPAAALLPGDARVQAIAVARDGTADATAVELPVYTPATVEAFATYGTIDDDAPVVLPVAHPRGVIEGFGGLEVGITATALHSLTDAVIYLCRYPFEGAEHLASRVLAIAALRDVLGAFGARGLPDPESLEAYARRDIALLVAAQTQEGGWAFWRGGTRTHPFVSIHVAHALQRAGEKGFDVPRETLERAADYLRGIERHAAEWPYEARRAAAAYALYIRHRIGDPGTVVQARGMAAAEPDRVGGELSVEAAAWLLHVLASDPGSTAAASAVRARLLNRMVETAGTVTFATRYEDGEHLLLHSRRRADAVVLEALLAAGAADDIVTRLARSLLAHRVAGRWSGTQENAWVLLALDRYFRTYEATTPAFESRVWLGERFAGSHAFAGRTTERQEIDIPMPQLLRADTQTLVVAREGEGRMYYRAALRYAPADLRVPALERGFEVARVYEPVDDPADVRRDPDGTWHVRAGARVRVRLTLVAPSVRYHTALVDPLPAGYEPLNAGLRGTGFADDPEPAPGGRDRGRAGIWRPRWYEHQNIRDDRVEAFASLLPAGAYEYTYLARATTPGRFVVPPPRAEMMYEPETFGRGEGDVVVVDER